MAPVARSHHLDDWQMTGEELTYHWGRWRSGDGPVHLRRASDGLGCTVTFTDGAVTGLALEAAAGQILTARMVRSFPFGQAEQAARRHLADTTEHIGLKYYDDTPRLRMIAAGEMQLPRMTRRGMAAVAALYCQLCTISRHPSRELADDLGTTKQKIHAVLRQAERNKLFDRSHLPKGGVAGGRLTAGAAALLETLEDS
jgi:DNA-binding MarR family transcriptional regulator